MPGTYLQAVVQPPEERALSVATQYSSGQLAQQAISDARDGRCLTLPTPPAAAVHRPAIRPQHQQKRCLHINQAHPLYRPPPPPPPTAVFGSAITTSLTHCSASSVVCWLASIDRTTNSPPPHGLSSFDPHNNLQQQLSRWIAS